MFKSHLAFLCFHTPPVPASVGPLRCQVALDLGALPETRSMGPAASPGSDVFKRSSDAHQGSWGDRLLNQQARRHCFMPQPTAFRSKILLVSFGWRWLDDGWMLFFIHNFHMISTLQEPPSRRPAGVAWRHRWPRPCTDSWSHCQAWRTGTRKIWWKRMDNWEKSWEMYCER